MIKLVESGPKDEKQKAVHALQGLIEKIESGEIPAPTNIVFLCARDEIDHLDFHHLWLGRASICANLHSLGERLIQDEMLQP